MRDRGALVLADADYRPDPADSSARTEEVEEVTLHCTGGGIVDKALKKVLGSKTSITNLNALVINTKLSYEVVSVAADFYREVNKVSTTYVIGYCGELIQTLPESRRAWSAGISKEVLGLYKRGFKHWKNYIMVNGVLRPAAPAGYYTFWEGQYAIIKGLRAFESPPDTASPLELSGCHSSGPDQRSISIDLLTPPYQRSNGNYRCLGPDLPDVYGQMGSLYTFAQLKTLRKLLRELATVYPKFAVTRAKVLPHSLTSPIERSLCVSVDGKTLAYGFDPGALNWTFLLND